MMNRRHRKVTTQNIYSATAQNGRPYYSYLPSIKYTTLSLGCFLVIIFGASRRHSRGSVVRSSPKHKCWLKHAIQSGEFKLFSHRSYHDNTQTEQPSCHDSLSQLHAIGVNHLDLDLVLNERDPDSPQLVVAHPMEFKQQSDYYSPCANTDFDGMIELLKNVYGLDFFISMEPKAAWGNTQRELDDIALTNLPSSILEILLHKIKEHKLDKDQCAAIVEIKERSHDDQELKKERRLLKDIVQHCQLFRGIRLLDNSPTLMGDYDVIMPTIEFHPTHPHNSEGKVVLPNLLSKSIFWVVDNEVDLELAAELHPFGVVSNSPKKIVDIVERSNWCADDANTK